MLAFAIAVFAAVLTAELVGDKLLYTIAAIAGRYTLSSVGLGFALACGGKMFAAVVLGRTIAVLPASVLSQITAVTFLIAGLAVWRRGVNGALVPDEAPRAQKGTLVTFASVFFTEWGDLGQITVASLAARASAPTVVWAAGTAAMLTKGALAVTIGLGLRRFLPVRVMHYAAVTMCLAMAVIAAFAPR